MQQLACRAATIEIPSRAPAGTLDFLRSSSYSPMGRWDFLEGAKPITTADAIVIEMARVIADELRAWPPRLEFTDPSAAARFAPLFDPDAPRPSDDALRAGFRLARWELTHDVDAVTHSLRNDRLPLAAELLHRLLPEILYELAERTENRLSRKHLVACLDLAERRALSL
jgi:hypothetical protein